MVKSVALVLAVLLVASSCDDDGPAPLEKSSLCSGGWQAMTAAEEFDTSSQLRYRDGHLYYGRFTLQGVVDLQVASGAQTVFPAGGNPDQLWVDGDRLLFTSGNLGTQVFSMPVTGGTPELILDGATGRTDAGWGVVHEITGTDIIWAEGSRTVVGGPTTVWRAPRSGGPAVQLGTASAMIPSGDLLLFNSLAVAPDAVLLASILGLAVAMPLDGSPVRSLATDDLLTTGQGDFAGIDATGVYWSIPRKGSRYEDDEWTLALAPGDGGPMRDFWNGLPAHSGVQGIWPRDGGGWVAVAMQLFDDHRFHATVWEIDADGSSRRLACSPDTTGREPWIDTAPAIAPDAIYLAETAGKFQIIRVPR